MNDETAFLIPAPGALIRFPNTPRRILQAGGEVVRLSPFWLRRLKGGDVVVRDNIKPNQEEVK